MPLTIYCLPLHSLLRQLKGNVRDLAQLVAHTSGGREVAGSSPVIPTEEKELQPQGWQLLFLLALFSFSETRILSTVIRITEY